MPHYYCNVLIAQLSDHHEELSSPDWAHVRNAFDQLREHGSGRLTLGRLSQKGRDATPWVAPVVQLSLDASRDAPWHLRGFGRDAEREARFSRYDQAFNALLRAFNSEALPELPERDGWTTVRESPAGPRRADRR